MADTTTMQELLVTTFATADALAKLLIENGLITQEEFSQKLAAERATYQKLLSHKPQ
jgi:predicted transcriptional regulator